MDISEYLRQTAVYEPPLDEPAGDRWNRQTHGPAVTIPVRKTTKSKLIKTDKERAYVDVTQYMTNVEVKRGGLIDGEEIMGIESTPDFDGTIALYKAFPRPPLGFTP